MIKFEHVEVVGWEAAIRGMRNPMNSWDRSDSDWFRVNDKTDAESYIDYDEKNDLYYLLGHNDFDLMRQLSNAGTDHRKFMRMITVYVDITAPLYWWKEFDTYKVGTVANSCSTMHKIHEKEFTLEDFSCEHLLDDELETLKMVIDRLNENRKAFIEAKTTKPMKDNSKRKESAKKYWWQMIQLLPSSYNQKRTVMLNYEVLANIYKSRKNHKLDCWKEHSRDEIIKDALNGSFGFCDWIKTLPYPELITGEAFKVGDKVRYTRKGSIYYGKEGYIVQVGPDKMARVQIPIQITSGDGFTTIPCSFDNLRHVGDKEDQYE